MEKQLYIFDVPSDRDRLQLQRELYEPFIMANFKLILDKYNLAEQLAASKSNQKLLILDVGCGEGYYLYALAGMLEERQLHKFAKFIGIDLNQVAIATADEFVRKANPPRRYIDFFQQDITQPLDSNIMLKVETEGKFEFDFIYATLLVEHLPHSKEQVARLYNYLKPGGIIFLVDAVYNSSEENGWVSPHPEIEFLSQLAAKAVISKPGWDEPAVNSAKWLSELGAEDITTATHIMKSGDRSPNSIKLTKNFYYVGMNAGEVLVKHGVLTQERFDKAKEILQKELTPESKGQITAIGTIAKKPLK